MRRIWITSLLTGISLVLAVAPSTAAERAKGPDVIQLSYSESDDGSSPPFALEAYGYRIDALRFATHYAGEHANGEARYDDKVTDTDIHAHGEARHPWRLIRRGEGKEVTRLIHKSFEARDFARVRISARGNGKHEIVRFTMVLARCSQDPPLYPVDCEFKV